MASYPPLCSCILLLLSVASSASVLVPSSGLSQINCSVDLGDQRQRCFTLGGGKIIVAPNIYLELPDNVTIQQDLLDSEYYFEVPLKLEHRDNANYDKLLLVTSFGVKLVSCRSLCEKVSVVSDWPQVTFTSDRNATAAVRIGCKQRKICQKVLKHMRFTDSARNRIGAMLRFKFFGQADEKQFTLTMTGVPVVNAKDDEKARSDYFWFEDNKILLFSIAANSSYEAADSFLNKEKCKPSEPSGGRIPVLFRSDLIDSMSELPELTGKRYIVTEMRAQNRMVAQVVFDLSLRLKSRLNKENWFDDDRVVSSHPYHVGTKFNFFSIRGHDRDGIKRSFFISFEYRGCPGDKAFWMVSDKKDICAWASKNWGGRSPSMVYTSSRGLADATAQHNADQFIVYLM